MVYISRNAEKRYSMTKFSLAAPRSNKFEPTKQRKHSPQQNHEADVQARVQGGS